MLSVKFDNQFAPLSSGVDVWFSSQLSIDGIVRLSNRAYSGKMREKNANEQDESMEKHRTTEMRRNNNADIDLDALYSLENLGWQTLSQRNQIIQPNTQINDIEQTNAFENNENEKHAANQVVIKSNKSLLLGKPRAGQVRPDSLESIDT